MVVTSDFNKNYVSEVLRNKDWLHSTEGNFEKGKDSECWHIFWIAMLQGKADKWNLKGDMGSIKFFDFLLFFKGNVRCLYTDVGERRETLEQYYQANKREWVLVHQPRSWPLVGTAVLIRMALDWINQYHEIVTYLPNCYMGF